MPKLLFVPTIFVVSPQVQHLHWHWADPLASVAIAALIVAAVWPLVQQSAGMLLEYPAAAPAAAPAIDACLKQVAGLSGIVDVPDVRCMQVRLYDGGGGGVPCAFLMQHATAPASLPLMQRGESMPRAPS